MKPGTEVRYRILPYMAVPSAERNHLLVVDDDPDLRDLLQQVLTEEGYRVETATDGLMALKSLRVGPLPRLILLDVMMPRMDGWQFCEARQLSPELRSIPIVLISAHAGPSRVAPYSRIAAVLSKPFGLDEVIRTVHRFAYSVTEASGKAASPSEN